MTSPTRHRGHQPAAETDNPYRRIVELSSAPLVVHRDFKPLLANEAYARLLHLSGLEEVLALDSLEPLIVPEFLDTARDRARRVMAGEVVDPVRHDMVDSHGQRRIIEFHDQRIDWYGEPAIFTRMVDVTRDVRDQQHLSRLTEELRAALAKAEREQQLRARFLARMSHELRTPLTTIFSSFDLIHLTPLDAKQERYVDMARNAAVHLRLLIDNLFEYARVAEEAREHQDESFSLETVLSELVDRYAGAGRDRDIRVFADIAGTGGPLMRGDRAGLTRIVASLVENALKLAATGTIRLSGRVDPAAKDGHVTVAITVTSLKRRSADEAQDAPMPPPSEPVKGIAAPGAQRADSQIAVESLPGGGSAFTVTMDMRAAGPGGDSNGQSGNGKPMSELTVLLVEDQVVNQELISEMLATMGYTVVPVGTGEEALERASDTPFDAILMDRRLPGMDGFETAAKLRETMDPCPPIVLLTADASRLPREELERTPFVAFVTKPIDWATLDEEVRAAVAARGTS